MAFFVDPSFFIVLFVSVVVAAVLGLSERPLAPWGMVVSALLLAGLFWGEVAQLVALALFVALSLACTRWLMAAPGQRGRFVASVLLVAAPLVIYKLTLSLTSAGLLGFVGISYATFKSVQVLMEVHDGLIEPKGLRVADQLYFLLNFFEFDSGPIDRSRRFVEDVHRRLPRDEYAELLAKGILLILGGLAYKMVIASLIHKGYSLVAWGDGPVWQELWTQVIVCYRYGLYLFFDFAGYTMMAMGAGYCLGVRVPRNFRAPFLAQDLIDFWNRWHITLSSWLRDFVFMRVTRLLMKRKVFTGRKGRLRTAQLGLFANMLLMGFWHGVTVDYVGYGIYHGILMAATEGWHKSGYYKAHKDATWFKVASWFVTMQLVFVGFALFSGQLSFVLKGVLNG